MWNHKLTIEVVYEGGNEMKINSVTPILKKVESALEDEAFLVGESIKIDSCVAVCDPVIVQ